jgi:colicin import membrane protein
VRPGTAISGAVHALVLGWGLVLFAVKPVEAPRTEAMPVDLVPVSELTELKAGTLKKTIDEPKKQAEKVAEPKPAPPVEAKPADKPEVKPQAAAPPPPPAESIEKLIDKMAAQEPAPAQPVRVPEPPKRPPIPKRQPKPELTSPAPPQRTFDPNRIAALLD